MIVSLPSLPDLDAVLFDAGETLIFMRPSFAGGYATICREAGIEVDEETLAPGLALASENMEATIRAKPDHRTDPETEFAMWVEFNRTVFECIGHPEVDPLAMSHRMEKAYVSGRMTQPEPDTLPTIRRLREAGLKIGIVSNASSGMAEALHHAGLTELADHISISADVGWEKPSPKIFEHCLAGLGVEPHRVIHVGDSLAADGEGAKAAGLGGFVHCANGIRFRGEHTGATISTLSELLPLLGF